MMMPPQGLDLADVKILMPSEKKVALAGLVVAPPHEWWLEELSVDVVRVLQLLDGGPATAVVLLVADDGPATTAVVLVVADERRALFVPGEESPTTGQVLILAADEWRTGPMLNLNLAADERWTLVVSVVVVAPANETVFPDAPADGTVVVSVPTEKNLAVVVAMNQHSHSVLVPAEEDLAMILETDLETLAVIVPPAENLAVEVAAADHQKSQAVIVPAKEDLAVVIVATDEETPAQILPTKEEREELDRAQSRVWELGEGV